MTPATWLRTAVEPAMIILPERMDSPEARAFMTAIALQESRLVHRRQIAGPARGFTQFELAGVTGVLTHASSKGAAVGLCEALSITPVSSAVYGAMEYQDVLTAGFARLLLWTLPNSLPAQGQPELAWSQYIAAWRPGRPHPGTWASCWDKAWDAVTAEKKIDGRPISEVSAVALRKLWHDMDRVLTEAGA